MVFLRITDYFSLAPEGRHVLFGGITDYTNSFVLLGHKNKTERRSPFPTNDICCVAPLGWIFLDTICTRGILPRNEVYEELRCEAAWVIII